MEHLWWLHLKVKQSFNISSHAELFCQGVLKNFAKFTGKHLCQRLFFKQESLAQVLSSKFCEISKYIFFTEHLQTTASDFIYDTENQSVKFLWLDKACFLLFCFVYGFKSWKLEFSMAWKDFCLFLLFFVYDFKNQNEKFLCLDKTFTSCSLALFIR